MSEEVFGQTLQSGSIVGRDGLFASVVDAEAGVFRGKEIGEFGGGDAFGVSEGVEEVVTEEFDGGHALKAAIGCEGMLGT